MSGPVLEYGPVLIVWAAVVYRLPALRHHPRDPGLRAFCLTLLCLAAGMTLLLVPVYIAVDRLTGIANSARLLANILVVVASYQAQQFVFHLAHPERVVARRRRGLGLLAGTVVVMTLLFALAPIDQTEPVAFMARYGEVPFYFEYRLVFLSWLGLAMYNVTRLSWHYADVADKPATRVGMRLVAAGAACGLLYVTHEGAYAATRHFAVGYPVPNPELATDLLKAVAVVILMVGSTMPAWGPHAGIPELYAWAIQYRAYQRLRPLWLDLYRAHPEIALLPPSSGLTEALLIRDIGFRLYRRVVEIRDGALALRPYLDPRVMECADQLARDAGIDGTERQALIEAAGLASAVRARVAGTVRDQQPLEASTSGGTGLGGEVAYLERVAHYYQHSTLVRGVVGNAGRAPGYAPVRSRSLP